MSGENLVTQASPSGGEVNSTESKPYSQNKMAVYMRQYRKRRKLAAAVANSAGMPDSTPADQSSPSGLPDAA